MSGFFVLGSCNPQEPEKEYLVKVYNQKLYEADLPKDVLENEGKKDLYIRNWIETNILYYRAKLDSRVNEDEIKEQVAVFKKELYYYYLEELLIKEKLDTVVSESELLNYYNNHKEEFILKDFLVKVMYLKVAMDAPELNVIKRKYLLKNPKDIDDVIQFAKIYSSNFYYDEDNWIYFDAVLKEVPLGDTSKEHFITQRKKLYFDDGNYYYFLNVLEYKLKDALSPLSFEKDHIRKKILNIRLKNTRDQIKEDIINKEYKKGNVTIH